MTTTHPITNNAPKLDEEPHAESDQKILDEISRHNHGIAEGFFQRFFGGSPLDNPLKKYAHHLRHHFVPRLPESEEEPDLPGTSYHFLFSSTTEYTWAKVQVIGLELDAEYYDRDSGLVQLYKYARKVFRSQPARKENPSRVLKKLSAPDRYATERGYRLRQEPIRRSEKDMLRLVKKRKVSGVVQMFSHQKVKPTWSLRSGVLRLPELEEEVEDGTFTSKYPDLECMVIYPLGRPLARFHAVGEFLRGFRDAIAGYRSLHLDGKILHRDISPNNIMLAEARKEGEPWGFLIDLDLSMELAVGPAKPGEIIGTKAFMAIDVMKRRQRSYRHDLESFLYVFLWVAICGGDRKLPADSRLKRWLVGDWSELAQKKTEDMEDGNFAGIVAEFTPQFRSLEGLAYRLRDVLFCEEIGAEELYSAFFSAIDETLALQRFWHEGSC
ncbi:hypothetical protein CDV31_012569 [Fusarium ambrosium]|uniref:EKC/KEOPS complex subunit BUD32 n=1 Tax=Fusarium ambrosium TaxID=131363 RepID=A0A428T933_9HYPO|nr:hypothetical protein CDV31_012569 [Fusarium ambrosium]